MLASQPDNLTKHYGPRAVAPTVVESKTDEPLVLPDLHGNVLKAIYFLERRGVLEIQDEDRELLGELYKAGDNLSLRQLDQFKNILGKAKFDPEKIKNIQFIGDILGDRGKNDIFMLYLLESLKKSNVKFDILFSNHDLQFISWILANGDEVEKQRISPNLIDPSQQRSFNNLIEFLKNNPSQKSEVERLYKHAYAPKLKLIDVSYTPPKFTLGCHAPAAREAVLGLAKWLFKDEWDAIDARRPLSNREMRDLALRVNEKFNELLLNEPWLIKDQLLKERAYLVKEHQNYSKCSPYETPLTYIAWNRYRYLMEGPAAVYHGHAGGTSEPDPNERPMDPETVFETDWSLENEAVAGRNLDFNNSLGNPRGEVTYPLGYKGIDTCYVIPRTVALVNVQANFITADLIEDLKDFDEIVIVTDPADDVIKKLEDFKNYDSIKQKTRAGLLKDYPLDPSKYTTYVDTNLENIATQCRQSSNLNYFFASGKLLNDLDDLDKVVYESKDYMKVLSSYIKAQINGPWPLSLDDLKAIEAFVSTPEVKVDNTNLRILQLQAEIVTTLTSSQMSDDDKNLLMLLIQSIQKTHFAIDDLNDVYALLEDCVKQIKSGKLNMEELGAYDQLWKYPKVVFGPDWVVDRYLSSDPPQLKDAYDFMLKMLQVSWQLFPRELSECVSMLNSLIEKINKTTDFENFDLKNVQFNAGKAIERAKLAKNNSKAASMLIDICHKITNAQIKADEQIEAIPSSWTQFKEGFAAAWRDHKMSHVLSWTGALVGAPCGMILGTLIFPGVGTIAGGLMGAAVVSLAGALVGALTMTVVNVIRGTVNGVIESVKARLNKGTLVEKIYKNLNKEVKKIPEIFNNVQEEKFDRASNVQDEKSDQDASKILIAARKFAREQALKYPGRFFSGSSATAPKVNPGLTEQKSELLTPADQTAQPNKDKPSKPG